MRTITALVSALLVSAVCSAQGLTTKWEELTAEDFAKAVAQAKSVCVLPMGVVEKHGPSGPLGTDLLVVRQVALKAAESEYALVFPWYFAGQISEAKHQPGTVAYSGELQFELLRATTSEMARNGCRKIVLVNGHGGNGALVQHFMQAELDRPHDYVVYTFSGMSGPAKASPAAAPSRPGVDGHAGENEIAMVMAINPGIAHPERGASESGANQKRLALPYGVSTAISWYSMFPNHYGGDASGATAARGQALISDQAAALATAIRAIKADDTSLALQKEFFERTSNPGAVKK